MSDNIQTFSQLLDKYKISEPLPAHVRRHQLKTRKKALITILKKTKRYNPLLGAIIYIYFLFKGYGITLSMFQSAAVLGTISLVTVATLSSGVYIIVKNVVKLDYDLLDSRDTLLPLDFSNEIRDDDSTSKEIIGPILPWPPKEKLVPAVRKVKHKIAVMNFDDNNAGSEINQLITKTILKELTLFRGQENIITIGTKDEAKIILYGAIDKIGKIYTLTIRATDKEKGKIIFIDSKQANSKEKLQEISRHMVEDLVDKIK